MFLSVVRPLSGVMLVCIATREGIAVPPVPSHDAVGTAVFAISRAASKAFAVAIRIVINVAVCVTISFVCAVDLGIAPHSRRWWKSLLFNTPAVVQG